MPRTVSLKTAPKKKGAKRSMTLTKSDRDVLRALKVASRQQDIVMGTGTVRQPLFAVESGLCAPDSYYSTARPMDIAYVGG